MSDFAKPAAHCSIVGKETDKTRAKRAVNTRLLVVTVILGAAAFVSGYSWYKFRTTRVADALKQRASALENEGYWVDAANYLTRYLQLEPNDADARVRLALAAERTAVTQPQRRRLIGLLYHTLGVTPERHDLRLKLAYQLLETSDYAGAQAEADKVVLDTANETEKVEARRIVALSIHARARHGGLISIEKAADAMKQALEENPADVQLAVLTAELYREHPQEVGVKDAASRADAIMEELISLNPRDPRSLIAHYNYRRRYGNDPNAWHDLERVLADNPDNVEALLLLAGEKQSAGGEKSGESGEELYQKVIDLAPHDPRGHIGLARLYLAKGNSEQAADVLLRGRTQVRGPSFELDAQSAATLIALNRLKEATEVLADFDRHYREQLPELTTHDRVRLENGSRLLHARLDIARGRFRDARQELNAILATPGQADGSTNSSERLHASAMLATVLAKLGRLDSAAAHWSELAEQSPSFVEARRNAAAAYLELGRPAEAIAQLEAYLQSKGPSPDAWLDDVQAQLQQQLRLSPEERNWSHFASALQKAKQQLPQRWELGMAEIVHWIALGTESDKRKAIEQIKRLESTADDNKSLLERLVQCYQQLGLPADAERVLTNYEKLEASASRRILARTSLYVQQGRVMDAIKLLSSAVEKSADSEQSVLRLTQVKVLLAAQQLDEAQRLLSKYIADTPNDRGLLLLGLEVALLRSDVEIAGQWENALALISGPDDFDLLYYRARRLIEQYESLDSRTRSELDSLVDSLQSERPDFCQLVSLSGNYAEVTGNRRQAVESYRHAIELGERRPEIFKRLIAALDAEGRAPEADIYRRRLSEVEPAKGDNDSRAIAKAIKETRFDDALALAKKAVERGSAEPMAYVWLANLYSQDGANQEAESVFRDAVDRFPDDAQVWNALFTYLVRTDQKQRARRALEKWAQQYAPEDPARQLILAQGYDQLGDAEAAHDLYKATIEKDSKNIGARVLFAKSLLASDVGAARREFESILRDDPANADARQHVASLLGASGSEEDWTRAMTLLEAGEDTKASEDTLDDEQLRAILLSRRGKNRSERLANSETARRILVARIGQGDGDSHDLERIILAGIYEQEAAMRDSSELLQAAWETLQPLVDHENPPVDYLAMYLQWLLRHLEKGNGTTVELKQEQRDALLSDARSRINELEEALNGAPQGELRFLPISFRVRLLAASNRAEEGLQLLNEFADRQLPAAANDVERAKILHQLGRIASSAGYHRAAEDWYRQLVVVSPEGYVPLAKSLVDQKKFDEAVEVCLHASRQRPSAEVATVLTSLLSISGGNPELDRRIRPLIDSALAADSKNVELLMSVAVRHATENNPDEAIKLFRQVIDIQPTNIVALNNLATLLSERPNELDDAREHVEQAIASSGRSPSLLDTLGTILTRMGRHDEAVETLEEAVAGGVSDPRCYFHLAAAYYGAGREADALRSLETALRYGVGSSMLTSGDRELLASLKSELMTTR